LEIGSHATVPEASPAPKALEGIPARIGRGIGILAVLAGSVLIASLLWTLVQEFRQLRREERTALEHQVVGFREINPVPNFAQRPVNWFDTQGDHTRLWAGWNRDHGHDWFQFATGEIPRADLSEPYGGRDVIRAIDRPVVEIGTGQCWERMPPMAPVAALHLGEITTVYPLLILQKVLVVNDEMAQKPVLVTYSPTAPAQGTIEVYNPAIEGGRVILGLSGYFLGRKPLFYDRETESLWVAGADGIRALTGPRKGTTLPRIEGELTPVDWEKALSHHPDARLVVGADRGTETPVGLFRP